MVSALQYTAQALTVQPQVLTDEIKPDEITISFPDCMHAQRLMVYGVL